MKKVIKVAIPHNKWTVRGPLVSVVFNIDDMNVHVGDYEAGVLHDARYISLFVSQLRHACDTLLKIKHKDDFNVRYRTADIHSIIDAVLGDVDETLNRLKRLNVDDDHIDYLREKFNNNISQLVRQRQRLSL
jgi:hypothetical protein